MREPYVGSESSIDAKIDWCMWALKEVMAEQERLREWLLQIGVTTEKE